MSNPKISVIVPVYNVEKYLSECLDSIVNQTLKDIEIICLNDGSTDNSLSILKEYAFKDERIILIDKENEGQGYARKVGLDIATGEYILFCDSDDYYADLTAFEELYNYIEKLKVDVVLFESIRYSKTRGFYKDIKDFLNNPPQKEIFTYLDIDNILFFRAYSWKKIYSKKFLDSYKDWYFPKYKKYQDIPLHFQIITRAKMSYINKMFYVYRMRINSATHTFNDKIICDRCSIFEETYKILKEKFDYLDFFNFMYLDFFIALFGKNLIIKIDTAKKIIDIIKIIHKDTDIFLVQQRESFFFFRAGLRMNSENYMDYLNKKFLKNIRKEIQIRDKIIKNLDTAVKDRDRLIKNLDIAVKDRDSLIKNLDITVKDRDSLIKNLDIAVKDKDNVIKNLDTAIQRLLNSWSYRIGRLFTYPLSLPLDFFKFIRDYNLIKKSNLFDSEYYLANNEDVKKAKVDPVKHYLQFGWKEGRNPSAEFDGNEYLNQRPDVRVVGICPLVHYLRFGKDEELSFIFEKIKNLESKNKTLENKNNNILTENKNLEKKLNEKSVEFEQLNRKKSELNIKLSESTKDFEKLNKKVTDLERFKNQILRTYKEGINKEKLSFEIEKFLESSKLGITDEKREPNLIVSLTSYPDRIYDIHYCIYSLLIQSLKPNKIILWLGEEQFPNRDKDLSEKLREFTKHGLTIKYTKDIKSYKKLIPALREYPNSIIVSADDDIFYRNNWLEKLYNHWKDNKNFVIVHRGDKIIIEDDKIIPFNQWGRKTISDNSSFSFLILSGSGALFPPNCLYKDVFNEEIFKKLAPNADDMWFWAMAVLNNTKIKIVNEPQNTFIYVNPAREAQLNGDSTLYSTNRYENDIQFKNILNYYPQIMEKLLNE